MCEHHRTGAGHPRNPRQRLQPAVIGDDRDIESGDDVGSVGGDRPPRNAHDVVVEALVGVLAIRTR